MADASFGPKVWDALRQLAFLDGERVAVMGGLGAARERAARDPKLEAARARLAEGQQAIARAASSRRSREAEVEDLNLRRKRTADRLASGKLQHEREIHAAEMELAQLAQAITQAESGWMESSTEEDEATRALPEVRAALVVEEREAAARLVVAQRDLAATEARLAEIDRVRREAAQAIPAEVRDRYRALYQRTGGKPFALVDAGDCSYCHRSLPAAAVQMLRARTGVPSCPNCGHLLMSP